MPRADVPMPPGYEGHDRFSIRPSDISSIVLVNEHGKPAPADWYPPSHPKAASATDPTKSAQRMIKTSLSHPLRIDTVATPGGGMIGLTFCPGKVQRDAASGDWSRDLGMDLDRIRDWGAVAVVTLMEADELARYKVAGMGDAVRQRDMAWHHLPIVDVSVPEAPFEKAWGVAGPALRSALSAGSKVLLHCRGGLGRTGTIAARLLIELGMPADEAIVLVRAARPGAIETAEQERYVRRVRPPGAAIASPQAS